MNAVAARTWKRFTGMIVHGGASIVLLFFLAVSLIFSINEANWVTKIQSIPYAVLAGLLFGWLLATTCWKGVFAALYSVVLSFLFTFLVVGGILPSITRLFTQPFFAELEGMRLRILTFMLRSGGWIDSLRLGGKVDDTGLFLFLFSFLGWNVIVWLIWWALRKGQPLVGLIPVTILMAVNVHLSGQSGTILVNFLFLALLIVARGNFTAKQRSWARRGVDFSEDLGSDWGSSAVASAFLIGVIALVFSLVGTPEGWRAINDLVERSRREMADTAEQLFSGVNPPPERPNGPGGPEVRTPNLEEIGSPLPRGNETIFRVWISDPAPLPESVPGSREQIPVRRHYWRSLIFDRYTGRGWETATFNDVPVQPVEGDLPGRYPLEQRYELIARHTNTLFAVNQPVQTSEEVTLHGVGVDASSMVSGTVDQYSVISQATDVTVMEMNQAGTAYAPEIGLAYLQLPNNFPERVRTLSQQVAGNGSPYERAVRIQAYLRTNYAYDLGVRAPAVGRDVVDYFLFDGQSGFCSHFATAMAVMLRSVGVPARVAAGYAMGSYIPNLMMYAVSASASHAWVEVFFPGYGWVEFEPTPAYGVFTYDPGEGPGSGAGLSNLTPKPSPSSGTAILWLLIPLGLVGLLWGAFFWSRSRRKMQRQTGALAESLYWRVQRELGWAGLSAVPSQTPFEYLRDCQTALIDYPRLAEGLSRVTGAYVQAVYRSTPPEYRDVQMSQWSWDQARWEWVAFLLRRRRKPA
jgi:transglutaminase-like putative cysteine protease